MCNVRAAMGMAARASLRWRGIRRFDRGICIHLMYACVSKRIVLWPALR